MVRSAGDPARPNGVAEGKLGARAMASSPRSPAPRRGTADDSISPVRTVKIGALTSSQARNALLLRGAAPSDELTRDELIGQLKTLLPEGTTAVEVRSRTSRFSGADSPAPLSPARRRDRAAAADRRRAAGLGGAAAAAAAAWRHATAPPRGDYRADRDRRLFALMIWP